MKAGEASGPDEPRAGTGAVLRTSKGAKPWRGGRGEQGARGRASEGDGFRPWDRRVFSE